MCLVPLSSTLSTLVKDKSGKFPTEEHNSVDEMMVNFKGKSTIKQYIRGKPNP
jgi:hypothetical protein